MNIETEIFKKAHVNFDKLEKYGFIKKSGEYKYSKIFMEGAFRADIIVDSKGVLTGKVIDLAFNEEYISLRIENNNGKFVSNVRKEYKNILEDIKNNCFENNYFIFPQANRITKLIIETYGDNPEYAWEKFPGFGIFRNPNNKKWYALIMSIDKSKLSSKENGEVEIINVKTDSTKISNLLKKQGFYPAYHMNKQNWISIILDDTIEDDEIFNYIKESHKYTEKAEEWIIPANPKYFDVISYIESLGIFSWKQPKNINLNDIVYIYLGAPYSAILYKCKVREFDLYDEPENPVMNLELIKKYNPKDYTFDKLKTLGVKSVRSPRRISKQLSEALKEE